jgi:hypothetical protein
MPTPNRQRDPRAGFTPTPNPDQDILDIKQVAALLRCTVDTVRRIPRFDLRPRRGPGKFHLYLREDVLTYLHHRPVGSSRAPGPSANSCNPLQHPGAVDLAERRRAARSKAQGR